MTHPVPERTSLAAQDLVDYGYAGPPPAVSAARIRTALLTIPDSPERAQALVELERLSAQAVR